MTRDEIEDYALEVVRDLLLDGVEFLAITENLEDDYPGYSDADAEAVYSRVGNILSELRGNL